MNYGAGTITIETETGAVISAGRYGIAAFGYDGGDITVTNYATVTASGAAIDATTTAAGTVVVDNYGTITGNIIAANATFDNEVGAVWNFAGAAAFGIGTNELINQGTIDTTGISSVATTGNLSISNTGTINVESGSLVLSGGVSGTGSLTIGAGASLELNSAVSSGQTLTFEGSTGTLKLDNAPGFQGVISGFTGNGQLSGSDHIDLADINYNSGSFTESFNSTTDTLSVSDGTNSANIHFVGVYQAANFSFIGDGSGGTIVYDPPLSKGSVSPVGFEHATGDGFVFKFASVNRDTSPDLHFVNDALELGGVGFANAKPDLNQNHYEVHANGVPGIEGHASTGFSEILKAQLHANDFHFV